MYQNVVVTTMAVNVQELTFQKETQISKKKKNIERWVEKKWYSAYYYIYFSTKTTKEICDLVTYIYYYTYNTLTTSFNFWYYNFRRMTKEMYQKKEKTQNTIFVCFMNYFLSCFWCCSIFSSVLWRTPLRIIMNKYTQLWIKMNNYFLNWWVNCTFQVNILVFFHKKGDNFEH